MLERGPTLPPGGAPEAPLAACCDLTHNAHISAGSPPSQEGTPPSPGRLIQPCFWLFWRTCTDSAPATQTCSHLDARLHLELASIKNRRLGHVQEVLTEPGRGTDEQTLSPSLMNPSTAGLDRYPVSPLTGHLAGCPASGSLGERRAENEG